MNAKTGRVQEVSRDFVRGRMFTNLLISVEEDPGDPKVVVSEDIRKFVGKVAVVSVDLEG